MAKKAILGIGIILVILSAVGYFYPENDNGNSVTQVDALCSSGFGKLTQFLSGNVQEACQQVRQISYAVYGISLVGVILIIIGAVIPGAKKEYVTKEIIEETREVEPLDVLKKRFEKGEITKEEFDYLERELGFFEIEREKKGYSVEELNKINKSRWEKIIQ